MEDKSDGKGCIGCPVEKGKTCGNCTHRGDLQKKSLAILSDHKDGK